MLRIISLGIVLLAEFLCSELREPRFFEKVVSEHYAAAVNAANFPVRHAAAFFCKAGQHTVESEMSLHDGGEFFGFALGKEKCCRHIVQHYAYRKDVGKAVPAEVFV